MEAGRELDALVAEKVMGWKLDTRTIEGRTYDWYIDPKGSFRLADEIPPYSTDIALAWQVVGKMRNPDFRLNREGDWVCCFGGTIAFCGDGNTAPLAICLAALKALNAEIPGNTPHS